MNQVRKFDWLKLAQALLVLNALVWTVIGISTLLRLASSSSQSTVVFLLIAVLMFGNAVLMLAAAWLLGKRRSSFYYFALLVLLVNILLTFTDQFGMVDLLTVLFDLLILGMLVFKRSEFLRPSGGATRLQMESGGQVDRRG